jgi:arabinose-5-phosphate isomerase
MGKAGLVGRKIAATLASTGTRSQFLHPAEAIHGDLGRVTPEDVALVLSHSGKTEEILRLVPLLRQFGVPLIAMTGACDSLLSRNADVVLRLGEVSEAGPLGLAPSSSTTAMMALGDALALVLSHARGFAAEDFARFHPGGNLGMLLSPVEDVMRSLDRCRVGSEHETVRELFVRLGRPGRRTGAMMLTDNQGRLSGLFTDSDLARLFEERREETLDRKIAEVMTVGPTVVQRGMLVRDAVERLASRHISELPVVDAEGRPCGMIDITDVVSWIPSDNVRDPLAPPTHGATVPFSQAYHSAPHRESA